MIVNEHEQDNSLVCHLVSFGQTALRLGWAGLIADRKCRMLTKNLGFGLARTNDGSSNQPLPQLSILFCFCCHLLIDTGDKLKKTHTAW